MKKRYVSLAILVIIICFVVICSFVGAICLGYLLGRSHGISIGKQRQIQDSKVERFFEENGYDIEIFGAHMNGREHEGPFLYGWNWDCFEIEAEVIMLYRYNSISEIDHYLSELDEETLADCKIAEDFVFYYRGNDQGIIDTIAAYCENAHAHEQIGVYD